MSLLTYEEALARIHAAMPTTKLRETETARLQDAIGRALAEPIYASEPHPRFDNSAVDGYCIGESNDAAQGKRLAIAGSSFAGGDIPEAIPVGCAQRVLTGSMLPPNAWGIAMQEYTRAEDGFVELRATIEEGAFIRKRGEDFVEGDMLASPSETVGPGHLALAASQGKTSLTVFVRVKCGILSTGDELVLPEQMPSPGKIRDTNTVMLGALVKSAGCALESSAVLPDAREQIRDYMQVASKRVDVLIVSGGASVGDRDFLPDIVSEIGELIFCGVLVRPGKPFLFGRVGSAYCFGLPGNPASSFVCFEIFIRDALRRLGGHSKTVHRWVTCAYDDEHRVIARDDFVRCTLRFESNMLHASAAGEQASFGLRSLAQAEALVRIPANESHSAGDARLALLI